PSGNFVKEKNENPNSESKKEEVTSSSSEEENISDNEEISHDDLAKLAERSEKDFTFMKEKQGLKIIGMSSQTQEDLSKLKTMTPTQDESDNNEDKEEPQLGYYEGCKKYAAKKLEELNYNHGDKINRITEPLKSKQGLLLQLTGLLATAYGLYCFYS
ncbi:hypothetical protein H311_04587, partial [Anncaliia algerae PRA109]